MSIVFLTTQMHFSIFLFFFFHPFLQKLRLAKAVLIDADILLLDEPTNHLDHGTVDWLINYLNGLTDTTVITVSHDTPFLEKITTDVIHYEQRAQWGPHRKLVPYR